MDDRSRQNEVALRTARGEQMTRTRSYLRRYGWPRLRMTVVVVLTGAAGFLSSHLLRLAGLDSMMLRYPLAVLLAYLVFLLLMWLWVRLQGQAAELLGGDGSGLPGADGGSGGHAGAGGRSGGGGASASWNEPAAPGGNTGAATGGTAGEETSLLELADGEAGIPVLILVVLLSVVGVAVVATSWVVCSAPVLMAELLVDAAIAGGLYRRTRGLPVQGWWRLCLAHTF
ncbi:hypothetical protein [Stenotrophomonas sp. 24(2023)]|uniref:hypothetical protein n=1 Tax=Stenotrophomonas sp. 24(2023) TaxID=3068324 RepID=UPI0027DF6906|nr:hypothetical protein [Stenotrophomonas sp. 24(2023)]WMJ69680.1 hypothetical protein Q9R17_00800 [Stenotrophomonas sp. 24(2023)]